MEKAKVKLRTRAFDWDVAKQKYKLDEGSVEKYDLGTINSEEDSGDFNLTRILFDENDILLLTGTYFLVML